MLFVSKFGGTSMADADAISTVADIVGEQVGSRVVVVSATADSTDALLDVGHTAVAGGNWQKLEKSFFNKHKKIINNLELELSLDIFEEELTKLLGQIENDKKISPANSDHLVSFGERVSSLILAKLLQNRGQKSVRISGEEIIFTDNKYTGANVDFEKTDSEIVNKVGSALSDDTIVVIPGFIACSGEKKFSTLGRGGSDFSAAIVASALGADELRIYTDVDGISFCDPKLIPEAKIIPQLTFEEANELAYFGAKVLHPKTIIPAVKKNIPVRVLNTFNSDSQGTLISKEAEPGIKAVAWKNNNFVIDIQSARMLEAHGFLAKIFNLFATYEVVVDVLATSEVSLSLTVDREPPKEFINELSKIGKVFVSSGLTVVCVVGEGIVNEDRILSELFSALSGHKIKMISQGASDRNITFIVAQKEAEDIVRKVFNKLFSK